MEASHMLAECNQKQRKRTKEVVLCKYEYRWALALYSLLMLQSCCQFFLDASAIVCYLEGQWFIPQLLQATC